MNELEKFIVGLNKIQLDYKKKDENKSELNEKIAEYLFEDFGWNLLRSIYTRKVQVSFSSLF